MRGVTAKIGVCATRMAERIDEARTPATSSAKPILRKQKLTPMRRIAAESGFDLARCYAYGDTAQRSLDAWRGGQARRGKSFARNWTASRRLRLGRFSIWNQIVHDKQAPPQERKRFD